VSSGESPEGPEPLRRENAVLRDRLSRLNEAGPRDEQGDRADLKALIDTSPVGVILFDAQGGTPVSFNREALRIVDHLLEPEQTPEELLQVISQRRGDGRQMSEAELPLTRSLATCETVRAEEIVLQAPDGRQVRTIINAFLMRGGSPFVWCPR